MGFFVCLFVLFVFSVYIYILHYIIYILFIIANLKIHIIYTFIILYIKKNKTIII